MWPSQLEQLLADGKRDGVFTQASFAVGTRGEMWTGGETDTWFDLASVTKVAATTTCILRLISEEKLSFDALWCDLLPEIPEDYAEVRLRDVMSHRAGYRPHRRLDLIYPTPEAAWAGLLAEKPFVQPCTETHYSCLGFLLLGHMVSRVAGMPFSQYCHETLDAIVGPGRLRLGLPEAMHALAAPTECLADGTCIQGVVHDENAAFLAPEAGNAGLFAQAPALGEFAQKLLRLALDEGEVPGIRREVLLEAISGGRPPLVRGLGFDLRAVENASVGNLWSRKSFGHLGFTGTSLWFEPVRGFFAVLLTNRVHPTRENDKIHDFRRKFHTEIYENIP